MYHDVIRLDDAAKLIDCAFVQVSKILENKKKNHGPQLEYYTMLKKKKIKKISKEDT